MRDRKEVLYAGFNLGFNASACIVSSTRGLLAAVSQERLDGVKNTKALPITALRECFSLAGVTEVDKLVYSHYQFLTDAEIQKTMPKYLSETLYMRGGHEMFFHNALASYGLSVKDKKLHRVSHHKAHSYAGYAFYGIPHAEHISITSDGFGDGVSYTAEARKVLVDSHGAYRIQCTPIDRGTLQESTALIYQFVTGALGFKEHQHEGKITGLAAYGAAIYTNDFFSLFDSQGRFDFSEIKHKKFSPKHQQLVENSTVLFFDDFLRMKVMTYRLVQKLLDNGARKEDIAASVQLFAERKTLVKINKGLTDYKEFYQSIYPRMPVYLSGGLFANVKLNQAIKDTGYFNNVFVCPPMGDEGTAVGAAIYEMLEEGHARNVLKAFSMDVKKSETLGNICIGTRVLEENETADSIRNMVRVFDAEAADSMTITKYDDTHSLALATAKRLANKKIVCLCDGRMEFGPRALCRRSILYDCTDKQANTWLNKQLNRTEFMPFAPVCLARNADRLFAGLSGGRKSARYMTMTFACKREMKNNYQAAVHVDGTARPQIVDEETSPLMHEILNCYEIMTSKIALINTSFNLHERPIVENATTAIESFLKSKTDVLVLDGYMLERQGSI